MKPDRQCALLTLYLRFLYCIGIFVLFYSIIGFLVLPPIAKSLLEKKLSEQIHRKVAIGSVSVNPYALSCAIRNLTVSEPDSREMLFSLEEFSLVLQGGSFIERTLILKELNLTGPDVRLSRTIDGKFNFSDLLNGTHPAHESGHEPSLEPQPVDKPAPAAETTATTHTDSPKKTPSFFFTIHDIRVAKGRVQLYDESKGETYTIEDIHAQLHFISNIGPQKDMPIEPTITATIDQSPVILALHARPFSEHPDLTIDMEAIDVDLPRYLSYLPHQFHFEVRSGCATARCRVEYSPGDEIDSLTISGEAVLTNLQVVDSDNSKLLDLPKAEIFLQSAEPLFGKVHLSTVLLQSPGLNLWRNQNGTLNVQSLIESDRTEQTEDRTHENETVPEIVADQIEIMDGKITFDDHSADPGFSTSLTPLNLKLTGFSTTPGAKSTLKLAAQTEAGETVSTTGSLSLLPFDCQGNVKVSGISAIKYAPYYRRHIPFVVKDGRMDIQTDFHFASGEDHMRVELSALTAILDSLKLGSNDETDNFLEVGAFRIGDCTAELAGRALTIGELSVQNGKISAIRQKDGLLNLQTLIPSSGADSVETVAPESIPVQKDRWKFLLKKATVSDSLVRFEDRTFPEPLSLLADQISLEAQNISLDADNKIPISLALRLNESGTVRAEGDVIAAPVFTDLKLSLQDVEIPVIQPYIPENVRVRLTGGKISAEGRLLLGASREETFNASYAGKILLSDFSAVDKNDGEDLLKWKELDFKGVEVSNNPFRIAAKSAELKEFFARVTVSKEKKINLLEIVGDQPFSGPDLPGKLPTEAKTDRKPVASTNPEDGKRAVQLPNKPLNRAATRRPKGQPKIAVDQITLQNGIISFSDNYVSPAFHAEMADIDGNLIGLSSGRNALADVHLRGKLYRGSPLEITGKIHPFGSNVSADLSVKFTQIDMTRWNPYVRKYVGYAVEKGNLHLELKYIIVKKNVDLQNNIIFDRLTLGEKVESAEATTLPVKFAISLLQDRNGEIHLGVPIKGNMDDPKFDLGQIVMGAIRNFILKAVTAPFTFLSAILPKGSGAVDRVEMVDASGKISEANAKKLAAIAAILYERPNLELDIKGYVEPGKARELLTQYLFDKKLKSQKLKEMMKKGAAVSSIDETTLGPQEYSRCLKMAYEEEFPKEGLKKLDFISKTPPEEMRNRLLSTIHVTEDDIRLLAYNWALKVKNHLLETGKVEPRRIFLLEPAVSGSAAEPKSTVNGVMLTLK